MDLNRDGPGYHSIVHQICWHLLVKVSIYSAFKYVLKMWRMDKLFATNVANGKILLDNADLKFSFRTVTSLQQRTLKGNNSNYQ